MRIKPSSVLVADMQGEFAGLKKLGVVFSVDPTDAGSVAIAVFEDTCGNLIQLYPVNRETA